MTNLFVKIITGYRKDQEHTIPADEAHKAYFLFLHPEQRGIFSTGLALNGSQIKQISPDYHAMMGWNQSHILDNADYAELRVSGINARIHSVLDHAKRIASTGDLSVISKKLSTLELSTGAGL